MNKDIAAVIGLNASHLSPRGEAVSRNNRLNAIEKTLPRGGRPADQPILRAHRRATTQTKPNDAHTLGARSHWPRALASVAGNVCGGGPYWRRRAGNHPRRAFKGQHRSNYLKNCSTRGAVFESAEPALWFGCGLEATIQRWIVPKKPATVPGALRHDDPCYSARTPRCLQPSTFWKK